ncbi:MAG: hypothetical protein HOG04_08135, partial [Nitrospinaceae bacterium]|nr:hypothetical protein [Nitrospinaceae bacterium]
MNNSIHSLLSEPFDAKHVRIRGADEASIAWWMSSLVREFHAPVIFVDSEPRRLRQIESNLHFFLPIEGEGSLPIHSFPAWDVYPYARISPSSEVMGARMAALDFLRAGGAGIVLTSPEALCGRIPPPERLRENSLLLREGEEYDRDELLGKLESLMYVRRSIVESPGEYAVRGGIVDFYSPQEKSPLRIDLKGDEIDSIREFHPQTQRSLGIRPEVRVFPARELVLTPEDKERGAAALRVVASEEFDQDRRVERLLELLDAQGHFSGMEGLAPFFLDKMGTFFDAVPGDALWVLHEPEGMAESAGRLWADIDDEATHAAE